MLEENIAELKEIVKTSNSFKEILLKLNKAYSGTALKYLKNKLDSLNISYSHLYENSSGNIVQKIPLEEILVENHPYLSSVLKERLLKEGLKTDICECCGLGNIWNGKPLKLQLDHINGNHNDNRLDNLRIICPNCHTQTDTWGNKKSKISKNKETLENHCKDCGKIIGPKSTYCNKCAPKHKNITYKVGIEERPSKEELLDLILTTPMTKVGDIYGVSDSCIRKWCKKLGLPYNKSQIKEYINNS